MKLLILLIIYIIVAQCNAVSLSINRSNENKVDVYQYNIGLFSNNSFAGIQSFESHIELTINYAAEGSRIGLFVQSYQEATDKSQYCSDKNIKPIWEWKGLATDKSKFYYSITTTKFYQVTIVACDVVNYSADLECVNPFGHELGQYFLRIYTDITFPFLYAGLLFIWILLVYKYRSTYLQYHLWMTVLLVISLISSSIRWGLNIIFNQTGRYVLFICIVIMILRVITNLVAHLMFLMLSIGYGVVLNHFTTRMKRVMILGSIAFITVDNIREIGQIAIYMNWISQRILFLFHLPIIAFEILFTSFIFFSLNRTATILKNGREYSKFHIFRRLIKIMSVIFIISILLYISDLVYKQLADLQPLWMFQQLPYTFWEIWYYGVILITCYVIRPSSKNQLYSFTQPLDDVFQNAVSDSESQDHSDESIELDLSIDRKNKKGKLNSHEEHEALSGFLDKPHH